MSAIAASIRTFVLSAGLFLVTAAVGHAQTAAPTAKTRQPAICAKGVRVYTDKSQVPVSHDTLTMPPADGPVRVTSPEEAEAAELAMRGRAGSVGATGVIVTDEVSDDGGQQRIHRSVIAVYVPADSARAQAACK
jgi:hypothetical protein